ncbi:GroES-like protein [Fimicolochytrium jonesii]|uniref:GroES-like protein n=1 Tax=Fimicolochytrium jonesii TaxID=1396493 RepID=UPI0022FF23F9|nr:GroES-like protein [Fimicolochytrium jonesii]KAI8826232.1 GroES-like protein [Fimicolochytrium jonesii]
MQVQNYIGSLPEKLVGTVPTATPTVSIKDPILKTRALEFYGKKDLRVVDRPRPMISHPKDAIVKITATTVCGSDLHLYHRQIPEIEKHDVFGHEAVGIIEQVGAEVTNLHVGQRVVISAIIGCGECWFCQQELFSSCETTNNSGTMTYLYGHHSAGIFGYSHLLGGYDGLQAEIARVPFANVNLLPLPDSVSDAHGIVLSDIACTGWHGVDLGEVSSAEGRNTVAVWGAGPVGLMAARWALHRGAKKVVVIDTVAARLEVARSIGCVPLDFAKEDVYETLMKHFPANGGGPDVAIDCVGFRYNKSYLHAIQRGLNLETDGVDVVAECIKCVRKCGVVVLIGDYAGLANQYPVGAQMEKGLTMRGGQVFVQKYWKHLLHLIETGEMDPSFVITHTFPFEEMPKAYALFDEKKDGIIKCVVTTSYSK